MKYAAITQGIQIVFFKITAGKQKKSVTVTVIFQNTHITAVFIYVEASAP